jgi:hypothetical protein
MTSTPDLITAIADITDSQNFPNRRSNFVAQDATRVLCWKILRKDPDEYEDHTGALISETENEYTIHEDGHMLPTFYPKRTPNGVTLYRMQTIRNTTK